MGTLNLKKSKKNNFAGGGGGFSGMKISFAAITSSNWKIELGTISGNDKPGNVNIPTKFALVSKIV